MSSTSPATPATDNGPAPTPPADPPYEPPESWIPADQRTFGLDRRTIVPGVAVLVLAAVISFVPALVDGAVEYDDPVRSGDVLALDKNVTFTPAVGWNVTDGVRLGNSLAGGGYPSTAALSEAGVTFDLQVADFSGSPEELLDQIRDTREAYGVESPVVENDAVAITSTDGHRGVMASFDGPDVDGVIAAFVGGDVGVEVIAVSPTTHDKQSSVDVAQMIESITIAEEDQ
ncbi:hypothetical protein [Rhodococcus sp. NBC_00294]|uniref:hypothetical protein n=1 Tax=Rhodococcus sp. NBC_00294 TaxID=2976004 RepID=UPI002E2E423C|nr:hypothetical protein [Rhodococcus sp. NBC_00294]